VGDQRLELVPPLESAQNLRIEHKEQFADLSHPPQVAAVGRWSTNTVAAWRQKKDHPLPWFLVAGKYVRYRVSGVGWRLK
jgi:hypothetical protein